MNIKHQVSGWKSDEPANIFRIKRKKATNNGPNDSIYFGLLLEDKLYFGRMTMWVWGCEKTHTQWKRKRKAMKEGKGEKRFRWYLYNGNEWLGIRWNIAKKSSCSNFLRFFFWKNKKKKRDNNYNISNKARAANEIAEILNLLRCYFSTRFISRFIQLMNEIL